MRIAACLLALVAAGSAEARQIGARGLSVRPAPSYVTDFTQAALPGAVTETRSNTAWDYGPAGTITSFAATVPRWPSWTQITPTQLLGLGSWISRQNIYQGSTGAQTRTVVNGNTYSIWSTGCTIASTGSLSGVTPNPNTATGWAGGSLGAASGTSATFTPTGTCTQVNVNIGFHAPPIVTTNAAVTVNADVASVPIASASGYNFQQGTIVATFTPTTAFNSATVLSFDDGTQNNRVRVQMASTRQVLIETTVSSAQTGSVGSGSGVLATLGATNKVAVSWGGSRLCTSLNGSPTVVGVTTSLPGAAVTKLELGNSGGANQLNGYIAKIAYYPQSLCNHLPLYSQ